MLISVRIAAILAASTAFTTAAWAANPEAILAANRSATGAPPSGKAALITDYAYSGQGLTGKAGETDDLKTGRFVETYELGPIKGASGYDGKVAWTQDPSGTVTLQNGGDQKALAVNQAYRAANLWWQADFGGATVQDGGQKSAGGVTYDVLKVTPKGGIAFEAWFDSKTHLIAHIVEPQGSRQVTTTLSEYSPVDGVQIAHQVLVSTGDPKYDQKETLNNASFTALPPDAAFAPPRNNVADFSIVGGKETVLPFRLINNHIYADAMVDGKGPFMFIFDTGGVNLVTYTTAKTLGLAVEGKMEATGAGSGHMEAGLTRVQSLTLGKATIKNQPFIVLPLDAMSNVEGVEETGMVGYETFRRFVTRIDYGRHTLTLIEPSAFRPKDAGVAVPITFNGNTIEAKASYDGIESNFTIDTGARSALTLGAPFVSKYDLREKAPKGVVTVSGWGVGGPSTAFVTRSGTLTINGITIHPVVEMSTDTGGAFADPSIAGNIGAGILKRFVVTLDYGHSLMYLKPIKGSVPDLDTFDQAGLWINEAANGFDVVAVTAKGPAERAGLRKGDIITAVNGKPAKALRLYELREVLRTAKPGTVEHFTVLRGGRTLDIAVTLEDMI